jgi:hypothetical protein
MKVKKIKNFTSEKISKILIIKCSSNYGVSQIKMDDFINFLQIDSAILELFKDYQNQKFWKEEIQAYP